MFEMKDGYKEWVRVTTNGRKTFYIVDKDENLIAKKCSKCLEVKGMEFFTNQANLFDGKRSDCRECKKVGVRKWQKENPEKFKESKQKWQKENPEKFKEAHKKWREANLEKEKERKKRWREENPEKVKEKNKRWREANLEKAKELTKKWYRENRERVLENDRKWRKENPERVALSKQKRRARKASLPNTLTTKLMRKLSEIQKGKCLVTDASENLHLEHFIPLSWGAGGGTTFENCYYMEGSLNISKGGRNPFEWIKTQSEDYQHNFHTKLVPMLAERNGMSVEAFTEYVYQCESNKKELA